MNFIYRCEECGIECPCILVKLEDAVRPSKCPFDRKVSQWNMLRGMY